MSPRKVPHDRDLFARLIAEVRVTDPEVLAGTMFGCPAAYAAGKMAFCVLGTDIGVRIPEARATALLADGTAVPFRPYGRQTMREWVQLPPEPAPIGILLEAVAFARRNAKKT